MVLSFTTHFIESEIEKNFFKELSNNEIEVFITAYLAGFERVAGESGTYYYHTGKDFTIWQYAANNDGIGFINTIYIGYADGYYDGTI